MRLHARIGVLVALAGIGVGVAAPASAAGTLDYATARLSRHLTAARATTTIEIDGVLNEATWRDAPIANGFVQREPREGEPASFDTEVRILYDADNIYFGVFNRDPQPNLAIVNDLDKDFATSDNDVFGIALDTFHDERNGYRFEVNPKGARWDAQCFNDSRDENANWDGVWYAATSMGEDGWYAEIAIPFRTVKFQDANSLTWGANFLRRIRRKNEDSYWAPLPRFETIERLSLAGTIDGMQGIRPGANLRVKPYALTSGSQVGAASTNGDAQFGIDAKYGVTSGLTWDFTVNTDFSQVEADEQQINLTRFSLLFPEKRDFFLENSGVFQLGTVDPLGGSSIPAGRQNVVRQYFVMFFTRRIGLSDTGGSLPILGGTRLTGRAGPVTIGALNIQQREDGTSPATNFTAVRLRRSILANSEIGIMALNKEESGAHFNRTLGTDANFRFFRNLTFEGFVAKTFSPAGVTNGSGKDISYDGEFGYTNNIIRARGSYLSIGENFNDEMGYVPRIGINKVDMSGGGRIRPTAWRGWMRETSPHTQAVIISRPGGGVESEYYDLHWSTTFSDSSSFEYGTNLNRENLTQPFVLNKRRGAVIQPGSYGWAERFLWLRTNASAPMAASIRYTFGDFYNGYQHDYQVVLTARVNEFLNLSSTINRTNIRLPDNIYSTTLISGRVNYSFSTRMFFNALLQYNTDAQQWTSNLRFNLIHRPLSDFFLVYNEQRDSKSSDLINRAIIAKLTYMLQL